MLYFVGFVYLVHTYICISYNYYNIYSHLQTEMTFLGYHIFPATRDMSSVKELLSVLSYIHLNASGHGLFESGSVKPSSDQFLFAEAVQHVHEQSEI